MDSQWRRLFSYVQHIHSIGCEKELNAIYQHNYIEALTYGLGNTMFVLIDIDPSQTTIW